jgi:hypothetical protein
MNSPIDHSTSCETFLGCPKGAPIRPRIAHRTRSAGKSQSEQPTRVDGGIDLADPIGSLESMLEVPARVASDPMIATNAASPWGWGSSGSID